MATYTGVADENGDFTIPFSQNYTSSQKVIVKASKDGAEKSIELFAPSDAVGGGAISWSGNNKNFPKNIGEVVLSTAINGVIDPYAFYINNSQSPSFGYNATKLTVHAATEIGAYAFYGWENAISLVLPETLKIINNWAFRGWVKATSLIIPEGVTTIGSDAFQSWDSGNTLILPSTIQSVGGYAFAYWKALTEITINAIQPPAIESNTFYSLNSSCVIKVPMSSLSAYKSAAGWSTYSSKIVGF